MWGDYFVGVGYFGGSGSLSYWVNIIYFSIGDYFLETIFFGEIKDNMVGKSSK
jgi:hypothetical protein